MKAAQPHMTDSDKTVIVSLLTLLFVGFVLPSSNQLLKIVGGPVLFTISFTCFPDSFRSRSGSLIPALWLTALLWICAAFVGVMSFFGGSGIVTKFLPNQRAESTAGSCHSPKLDALGPRCRGTVDRRLESS